MAVNTKIYDDQFFNNTVKLEHESASAVAEILIKAFAPKSVIDVGCGVGLYLAEFNKHKIEIMGFDGSPAAISGSLVGDKIKLYDLSQPLILNRQFDLCLCFEVAEHLPEASARVLVGSLAGLAKTIVFTAATPGQGPASIGHINEQPHQYWENLFKQKNFLINKSLTEKIRQEMINKNVVWWLTKNLMIFETHEK